MSDKNCIIGYDRLMISFELDNLAHEYQQLVEDGELSEKDTLRLGEEMVKLVSDRFYSGTVEYSTATMELLDTWNAAFIDLSRILNKQVGSPVHFSISTNKLLKKSVEIYKVAKAKVTPVVPKTKEPISPTPEPKQLDLFPEDPTTEPITPTEVDEVKEEDLEVHAPMQANSKVKSIASIVIEYLGDKYSTSQEELIQYVKSRIAEELINTEVYSGEDIVGFRGVEETVSNIKSSVRRRAYDVIRNTMRGEVQVNEGDSAIDVILIADSQMDLESDVNYRLYDTIEGGKIWKHSIAMLPGEKRQNILVFQPDAGVTGDVIIEDMMDEYLTSISKDTIKTQYVAREGDVEKLTADDVKKQLLFDIVISEHLESFLYQFYPGLLPARGVKPKHRVGFSNIESVSSADQDTERLKLIKTTTPRLTYVETKNGIPILAQSGTNPYLTTQQFDLVSELLIEHADDLYNYLEQTIKQTTDKDNPYKTILTSIFYHLFYEGEYIRKSPNFVTGKVDETAHRSLSSIAVLYGYTDPLSDTESSNKNVVLDNVMAAMITSINSNVSAEKVLSTDLRTTITNSRAGDVKNRVSSTLINALGMENIEEERGNVVMKYKLRPTISAALTIPGKGKTRLSYKSNKDGTQTMTIFVKDNEEIEIVYKKNKFDKGKFVRGVPVSVISFGTKGTNNATNNLSGRQVLARIFPRLGVPAYFFSPTVYKNIEEAIKTERAIDKDGGSEYGSDTMLMETFFVNLLMQLGNAKKTGYIQNPIDDNGQMWGYLKPLTNAFVPIIGNDAVQFIRSYKNDKLAVQSPISKARKIHVLINKAKTASISNVNNDSYILNGGVEIGSKKEAISGIYSKMGASIGNIAKSNAEFSATESINFLIQKAFGERLFQTSFKNALIQIGAMSDRTDIPLADFKGTPQSQNTTEEKYIVFPTKGTQSNAKLDEDRLKMQWTRSNRAYNRQIEGSILSAWRPILNSMGRDTSAIVTARDLKNHLRDFPIAHHTITKEDGLLENVMLVKGPDGNATLDEGLLSTLEVFHSDLEMEVLEKLNYSLQTWSKNKGLTVPVMETIEQFEWYVKNNPVVHSKSLGKKVSIMDLFFNELSSEELIELNLKYDGKLSFDKEIKDDIKTLKGNNLVGAYLEYMKGEFDTYLKDSGYEAKHIDEHTVLMLADKVSGNVKYGTKMTVSDVQRQQAYDVLTTAYFYNQSTLGQEALHIYGGANFQYKPQRISKKDGKISYFNLNADPGKKDTVSRKAKRRLVVDELNKEDEQGNSVYTPAQKFSGLVSAGILASHSVAVVDGAYPTLIANVNGVKVPIGYTDNGKWEIKYGLIDGGMGAIFGNIHKDIEEDIIQAIDDVLFGAMNSDEFATMYGAHTFHNPLDVNTEVYGDRELEYAKEYPQEWSTAKQKELEDAYKNEDKADLSVQKGVLKADGSINTAEVLKQAKEVLRSGANWEPNKFTKGKVPGLKTIIEKYDKYHRFVWMAQVLNPNLKISNDKRAELLLMDDIGTMVTSSFVDQVKRNQSIGTLGQSPSKVRDNDYGLKMGSHSKTVTYKDPEMIYRLLGESTAKAMEIYDGIQIALPTYRLKLNNSLGNNESNFSAHGAPIKDTTNSVDKDGYNTQQKKATFDLFNNDFIGEGTPELNHMFDQMTTTILYPDTEILVSPVDGTGIVTEVTAQNAVVKVNAQMWIENGVNLGRMFDTLTGKFVHAKVLLERVRAGLITMNDFETSLSTGRYATNKVARKFKHLKDLWEYFGSVDNENSWDNVGFVIGNFSGQQFKGEATVKALRQRESATYPLRDAMIEKTGMQTQQKVGSKHLMDSENATSPFNTDSGFLNSDGSPRYDKVSNDNHFIILQAEHSSDTTVEGGAVLEDLDSDGKAENNTVALITQVINANIAEGKSFEESIKIATALGTLADTMVEVLTKKIYGSISKTAEVDGATAQEIHLINEYLESQSSRVANSAKVNKENDVRYAPIMHYVYKGYKKVAKKELQKTLATRNNPGVVEELVNMDHDDTLSFDLKQIQPLAFSIVFANYNKEGVRYRFKGGLFVVSPSDDFRRTYTVGDTSNLTRKELNEKIYSATVPYDMFKDTKMTPRLLKMHTMTDKVILDDVTAYENELVAGQTISISSLRRILKARYTDTAPGGSFEDFYTVFMTHRTTTRLGNMGAITNKQEYSGEKLKWVQYTDKDNTDVKSTEEFRSYQLVGEILNKGLSAEEILPVLGKDAEGRILLPRSIASLIAIRDNKDFDIYGWASIPSKQKEFDKWYDEVYLPMNKEERNAVAVQVVEQLTDNSGWELLGRLKINVQRMLEDDTRHWTSTGAEHYLPSLHQARLLIKDEDTIGVFQAEGEQPDYNTLVKAGVFEGADARKYAWDIDAYYGTVEVDATIERLKSTLPPEKLRALGKYIALKEKSMNHLKDIYKSRVEEVLTGSNIFDLTAIGTEAAKKGKNPIDAMIKEAKVRAAKTGRTMREGIEGGGFRESLNTRTWDRIAVELEAGKKIPESWETIIGNIVDPRQDGAVGTFTKEKSVVLARSFNVAREFITARIPAQGKQSYTRGFIKNFIGSTKNSSYGPIESILITGADHDIDKQSIMTWTMDEDGRIVNWKHYTSNKSITGVPTKDMLNRRIEDATATLNGNKGAIGLMENLEYANFIGAVQNSIIFNLLQTIGDPKNAIEAETTISMDEVAKHMLQVDYSHIDASTTPAELLAMRKHAYTQTPSSMMMYEKINADGKSGIGIFASDLKSYLTVVAATLTSSPAEIDFIKFTSPYKKVKRGNSTVNLLQTVNTYLKKVGVEEVADKDAIQFITINDEGVPTVQNIYTFANTGYYKDEKGKSVFMTYNKAQVNVKKFTDKLKRGGLTVEQEEAIIMEAMGDMKAFDKMTIEPQAWADLSELLSAATDNAKELILGKIGANNTTSSVISTMIRMGITLGDAIQLMQEITSYGLDPNKKVVGSKAYQKRVRNVFQSVINDKDTLYKAHPGAQTFGTLSAAIEDVLKESSITGKDLVLDPLRRLQTFVKIQEGFSTWNKIVSTNQGIKIAQDEVWRWLRGLEQSIERPIREMQDATEEPFKFNLEKFIFLIKSGETIESGGYVKKVIDLANKSKVALNIPYLLYKSPQYSNYITALFEAKRTMNMTSSVYKIADELLTLASDTYNISASTITTDVFRRVTDYIHGIGIGMYFKEVPQKALINNLMGKNYDLSMKEGNEKLGGRREFIRDMPGVIDRTILEHLQADIPENSFLQSLSTSNPVMDYSTQTPMSMLEGPDVKKIGPNKEAELQIQARLLKDTNPVLFHALFSYGLIVNKGAYGGGSFLSLMGPDEFNTYNDFLDIRMRDKDGVGYSIEEELTNIPSASLDDPAFRRLVFNVPQLLPSKSTSRTASKAAQRRRNAILRADLEKEGHDMSHMEEENQDPHDIGEDLTPEMARAIAYAKNSQRLAAVRHEDFDLSEVRVQKLKDEENYPDVFTSKENGIVYIWYKDIKQYVPLVQTLPGIVLPYDPISGETITTSSIAVEGFEEGWKIKHGNREIQLLSYVDDEFRNEIVNKLDEEIKEIENPYTIIGQMEDYYVVKENGIFKVMSRDDLKDFVKGSNINLILDGPKMYVSYTLGSNTEETAIEKQYKTVVNSKGEVISIHTADTEVDGSLISLEIRPIEIANSNSRALYGTKFFEDVTAKLAKKGINTSITLENISEKYRAIRKIFLLYDIKDNPAFDHLSDIEKENIADGNSTVEIQAMNDVLARLEENFPADPGDTFDKIAKLQLAEEIFDLNFDTRTNAPQEEWTTPLKALELKSKAIPSAIIEGLANRSIVQSMSVGRLKEVLESVGLKSSFKSYINKVMLRSDTFKVFEDEDGQVHFGPAAITATAITSKYNKEIDNDPETDVRKQKVFLPNGSRNSAKYESKLEIFNTVVAKLNIIFPDTEYSLANSDVLEKIYGVEDASEVRALVYKGKIIFNMDLIEADTPFHEYSHIYFDYLKLEDRALYDHLIDLALKSPLKKEVSKIYKGLEGNDLGEEILAELVARRMNNNLIKDSTITEIENKLSGGGLFGKIRRFFNEFMSFVFGAKEYKVTLNDSLDSVIKKIGNKMAYGSTSIFTTFTPTTIKLVEMGRTASKINIEDAVKLLKEAGFIQYLCK